MTDQTPEYEYVFTRTCETTGKLCFPSAHSAKKAARNLDTRQRAGDGFLRPYRCGGHWHIGHASKQQHKIPGRKFRL